jgi:hypothetical protein
LVKGKTIGIDATTLEANAALRTIVRRDTGEGYEEFLTKLAKASGIGTPTRADLARIDRKRKKKGSNDEWRHPHDPDAKITKMKDGRTHLAHKAEHAIDLETGAIVGATVQGADQGDTTTIQETLPEAAEQLEAVAEVTKRAVAVIEEVVADKGYHQPRDGSRSGDAGDSHVHQRTRSRAAIMDRPTPNVTPCMRIAVASEALAENASFDDAGNCSNAPAPICTRLVGCGALTCAAIQTC